MVADAISQSKKKKRKPQMGWAAKIGLFLALGPFWLLLQRKPQMGRAAKIGLFLALEPLWLLCLSVLVATLVLAGFAATAIWPYVLEQDGVNHHTLVLDTLVAAGAAVISALIGVF